MTNKDFKVLFPELSENQLKMLHRLIVDIIPPPNRKITTNYINELNLDAYKTGYNKCRSQTLDKINELFEGEIND